MSTRPKCIAVVDKQHGYVRDVVFRLEGRYPLDPSEEEYLVPKILGRLIERLFYRNDEGFTDFRWEIINNALYDRKYSWKIPFSMMDNSNEINRFIRGVTKDNDQLIAEIFANMDNEETDIESDKPFDQERYDKATKEINLEFDKIGIK
jgi:hypothetical protein